MIQAYPYLSTVALEDGVLPFTTTWINRLVTTAMEPSSQDRVNQQPVRRFNHPFYTAGSIILT